MNKKFIVGLSSLAVAGTFLACGSGEILEPESNDKTTHYTYLESENAENDLIGLMNNAIKDCKLDPACSQHLKDDGNGGGNQQQPTPASSASQPSGGQTSGGASSAYVPPKNNSSSSVYVPGPNNGTSSSSSVVPPGPVGSGSDIGTCAPVTNPINKTESVVWKFNFNGNNTEGVDVMQVLKYDLTWDFGAAGQQSGLYSSKMNSEPVTYLASGLAKASVIISGNGGLNKYSVQCEDLQVNGAPITGCKCAATAATADVADGGIAGWTVAGCVSTGANIIGYEWTGAVGAGESATHTFTEKGQTLAPTVKVSNDDNTVEVVACDVVTAVDASSPDYLFEIEGQLPQSAIEVKNKGCMTISGTWNNPGYNPNIQVLCDMTATSSPVSFKMTYGDKVYETVGAQSWGFSNQGGAIGQLTSGTVKFDNICVEFSGAEFVKCKVQ